jgi:hypothetical protein
MCGRKNKFWLFILLLALPISAEAKKTNFSTGIPFGLGFRGILSAAPDSGFVAEPQTKAASYGKAYSFEPFFDFSNFVVRGYATLHDHPLVSGTGTGFAESSEAAAFGYGFQVLLAPLISETKTTRGYVFFGVGQTTTNIKTTRNYLNAQGATTASYLERARSTSEEITAGLGFDFIFVQNYSMQIEMGFRKLSYGRFSYESTVDRAGTTRGKGEVVLDLTTGNQRKFDSSGAFGSVALNLNF